MGPNIRNHYGSLGMSDPELTNAVKDAKCDILHAPLCEEANRKILEPTNSNTPTYRFWLVIGIIILVVSVWVGFNGKKNDGGHFHPPKHEESLIENIPLFFEQKVDHFDDSNDATWQNRYYAKAKHFKGPGHPIILIVGGEDGNDDGFFYPFIEEHLASTFGAFTVYPEHRFYGISQPVDPLQASTDELLNLFSVKQALADMLTIVQFYQDKLGCSRVKTSPKYCPVMSVGGSYPGFLSAILRSEYSDIVDIGYASSAPLLLYSMEADQFGYFDVVTRETERSAPGCSGAVRDTLSEVNDALRGVSVNDDLLRVAHKQLNICPGSIPDYVQSGATLSEELMMLVATTFADMNMFDYPPNKETYLKRACHEVFLNDSMDSYQKLARFWRDFLEENIDPTLPCFDMSSQLPKGRNPTISASDWTGVGTGQDGFAFDFHCCATLTPPVGFSESSMFPYRKWTLEWLTNHCVSRFGVVPDPYKLVREYHFNDLVGQNATRILFTNGLRDLWSVGSYLEPLSEFMPVVNMEMSAHHSELKYTNAMFQDSKDVRAGHKKITSILTDWFNELKGEEYY